MRCYIGETSRWQWRGKPAVGDPRGEVPAKLVEMRRIYEAESGKLETEREAKERWN